MFILMLYTSSFFLQPKTLTMTTFETKELCQQALVEAKKEWVTMNFESKCVDLNKETEIQAKEKELKRLKDDK